jgi:hypothetical protein
LKRLGQHWHQLGNQRRKMGKTFRREKSWDNEYSFDKKPTKRKQIVKKYRKPKAKKYDEAYGEESIYNR